MTLILIALTSSEPALSNDEPQGLLVTGSAQSSCSGNPQLFTPLCLPEIAVSQ